MGIDAPETCRVWRIILRICCVSSSLVFLYAINEHANRDAGPSGPSTWPPPPAILTWTHIRCVQLPWRRAQRWISKHRLLAVQASDTASISTKFIWTPNLSNFTFFYWFSYCDMGFGVVMCWKFWRCYVLKILELLCAENFGDVMYWKFWRCYVLKILELLCAENFGVVMCWNFWRCYVLKILELSCAENFGGVMYWKFWSCYVLKILELCAENFRVVEYWKFRSCYVLKILE